MLKRTLLTFPLLSCWLAAQASSQMSKYRTVRAQDMSYASVIRINIRVSVPAHYTKNEVERIAKHLADSVSRQRNVNAVSVMFFGPATATDGPWDVAVVDWAPNGDWTQADAARAGDYKSFRYSVSHRPARSARSPGSLVLSDRRGLLGVPLPRGASLIARREGKPEAGHDPSERYQVKASADAIAEFYLREMPKLGWWKDGTPTQGALFFKKGRQILGVLINQSGGTFTLMGS
jgi:hypothetical protein